MLLLDCLLPEVTCKKMALDDIPGQCIEGSVLLAGVAASFAMAGLGTDTGNSIRGPSGWTSNVGIRASLGLSSRLDYVLYLPAILLLPCGVNFSLHMMCYLRRKEAVTTHLQPRPKAGRKLRVSQLDLLKGIDFTPQTVHRLSELG